MTAAQAPARWRRALCWALAMTAVVLVAPLAAHHPTESPGARSPHRDAAVHLSTASTGLGLATIELHTSAELAAADAARPAPPITPALAANAGPCATSTARSCAATDNVSRGGLFGAMALAPWRAPPLLRA